jgi:putative oxidoreductase
MKKLLNVNQTSTGVDAALLIARLGIGAMMLTHGLPKLAMLFSGDPVQFLPIMGLSPEFSLSLAVFAEVFCSILLLVGFGTRLAVLPLITTMLVALFTVHAADPFAKQEPAFHYLLVYVVLLLAGSGKYSVDYLLQRRFALRAENSVNSKTLSIQ